MSPQPISWLPHEDESNPLDQRDLAQTLERQIAAGFPPGLALDLVLNELVVQAATATRARSAALALKRGDEMVCRAATGQHAPDLGIPLNTRNGLSGACLRTRQSQLCLDTETDARVDADASRRLGIRSMLVVPVLEGEELVGVLEVFGTEPSEFVNSDQNLLEIFARQVTQIRHVALELEKRPAAVAAIPGPQSITLDSNVPVRKSRAPYEVWSVALGGLAVLLSVALSFMIGSRIGWLGPSSPSPVIPSQPVTGANTAGSNASAGRLPASPKATAKPGADSSPGGLVVYEQGKVVFRLKPARPQKTAVASAGSAEVLPGSTARVWLAPDRAESRLRERIEPQYPSDALATHRSGEVVLEVVVGTDGSIVSTRPVTGDPLLAAAASDAVRTWRYEPYRLKGHPAEFQTDVTLKFSLPD